MKCWVYRMNEYLIKTEYDVTGDVFREQCGMVEKNIPGIVKGKLLIDVDSSLIQEYALDGEDIFVFNSTYWDSVHIKSNLDLTQYPGALMDGYRVYTE